jgi:DNA-binding PadR family transcriptional regulator
MRVAALDLLAERPMHGYEIIQELESRSGGVWKPSPGSVYPTLQLLQDEGLVTANEVDGRRVFTLTDEGRARATARAESGAVPPWVEMADDAGEPMQRMGRSLRAVVVASKQLLRDGSPGQQQRAEAILAETRRRLYALLADDDETAGDDHTAGDDQG